MLETELPLPKASLLSQPTDSHSRYNPSHRGHVQKHLAHQIEDTHLDRTIPEIFRPRPREDMQLTQGPSQGSPPNSGNPPAIPPLAPPDRPGMPAVLSLSDLCAVAADIKSTLSTAISGLKAELQGVALRVEEVETTSLHHDNSLCHLQQITESHSVHLIDLNRHLEDLDNCG